MRPIIPQSTCHNPKLDYDFGYGEGSSDGHRCDSRQASIDGWEQFQTELAIADYECQERFDLYRIYDEVFWELRIEAMSTDEHLTFSFHEKAEQILEHGQAMITTGELTTR